MDLNKLRDQAYKNACEHGFHDETYNVNHYLCLIISELMEAVEADRKRNHADMDAYKKYEGRITFEENFVRHIKNTVEDELADACIRILDMFGATENFRNTDLNKAIKDTVLKVNDGFNHYRLFTEKIYSLVHDICASRFIFDYVRILKRIFNLADSLYVDIERHIELKMRYNQSRLRLHGKKY